jgi:hypothetical protein
MADINLPSIPSIPSIPKVPCGLDFGLENVKLGLDKLANDIFALGGGLQSELNRIGDDILAAIGDIEIPSMDLKSKFGELLASIGSGDPLSIASLLRDIRMNFPDFDLQGLLDKISLGEFNFCTDVPNQQIINGEVVEKAIPPSAPTADAEKPKTPPNPPEKQDDPPSAILPPGVTESGGVYYFENTPLPSDIDVKEIPLLLDAITTRARVVFKYIEKGNAAYKTFDATQFPFNYVERIPDRDDRY